jgi:organic hydroperoxide reductase OsmC/OhrA
VQAVAVRAKRFEYSAGADTEGRIATAGAEPVGLGDVWAPDDLLLAALARCTLESLRHHAGRSQLTLAGNAGAHGVVTRREEDHRYALVEVACELDVQLDPEPPQNELLGLLAAAERDCFVGASLTAAPRYTWRVNGHEVG